MWIYKSRNVIKKNREGVNEDFTSSLRLYNEGDRSTAQ